MARNDVVIRVLDCLPRPADVARRQCDAVAPANVVAQAILNRQAIAADAAICLRRYGLHEDRNRITLRVGRQQRLEHQAIDEDLRTVPASSGLRFLGSSPMATRKTPARDHGCRPWVAVRALRASGKQRYGSEQQ